MENIAYNKREAFKEHVEPLLAQLEKTCVEQQIPFFFSAAVENTPEGTGYESRARTAAPFGMLLTNDLLLNHVKVSAGFEVILPESIPDIQLGR